MRLTSHITEMQFKKNNKKNPQKNQNTVQKYMYNLQNANVCKQKTMGRLLKCTSKNVSS